MEYKCEKCDGFCELNITGTCIGEEDQPPLRCPSANIDAEWVMVEDAPGPASGYMKDVENGSTDEDAPEPAERCNTWLGNFQCSFDEGHDGPHAYYCVD